jgi:hypothetical protein
MTVRERLAQIIEALPEERAENLLETLEAEQTDVLREERTAGEDSRRTGLHRTMTPEEFRAALERLSYSTGRPPLSGEEISRETIYD